LRDKKFFKKKLLFPVLIVYLRYVLRTHLRLSIGTKNIQPAAIKQKEVKEAFDNYSPQKVLL